MKCWTTKSGQKLYRILFGRCNCFLLSKGGKFLLIDCGGRNRWNKLKKRLEEAGVNNGNLAALILTHSHFDHAENACKIKSEYNAKLIVHKLETENIKNGDNPAIRGTNPVTRFLSARIGKRISERIKYDGIECDIVVDGNYNLKELGFNAYIMHTPGHSAGSMSIIIDDEIAVVGDAMFGVYRWFILPPFGEKEEELVKSWKKLLDTGCYLFLPSHGIEDKRRLVEKNYRRFKRRLNI